MIAITGHTKGFGKYMFDRLGGIGLSRSNGYNIKEPMTILEHIKDCDIFINNAHDGFSQVELLYAVFEEWQHENKLIINIGSRSKDFSLREREQSFGYSVEKLALDHASKQLAGTFSPCKVSSIHFGKINKIGYDVCFSYVKNLIDNKNSNHHIIDMHIRHD
jgi:hypothetical protein